MGSTSHGSPDVLVVARSLWAGKWLIAGCVAAALVLAAMYLLDVKPKYTAVTVLSLEGPAEELMKPEGSREGSPVEERGIETEVEVLRSRSLVERLVQEMSLADDPEFNPALLPPEFPSIAWWFHDPSSEADTRAAQLQTIQNTSRAISVKPVENTYLIEVLVESNSPEKSAEMANTLAQLYITVRRESDLQANSEVSELLAAEVSELKEALEASERQVREFSASAEITSLESLGSQTQELKALRDRYLHSQTKAAAAEARVTLLNELLENATPAALAAVAADPVLSAQLGSAAGTPADVDSSAVERLLARFETEMERERAFAETTAAAISDLEIRVKRQSDEVVQLGQLEREVEVNSAIYEFALNRLRQLTLQRGTGQTAVKIISEAEPPLGPSGPGSSVVLALASVFGTIVGVAAILVRQTVRDTFRMAQELEELFKIQVLGQVVELPFNDRRQVMEYIEGNDGSLFLETVRNLRTSILSSTGKNGIVIALTSALPAEGKTTLALALARSMADIGRSVLLIDADLRRQELGQHFDSGEKSGGLVSAILDQRPISEFVNRNESLKMMMLLSEDSVHNPADLFSRVEFGDALAEARRDHDVTIIDAPPTLLVPDAKLIAPHADMVLMVVRWDYTTKSQLAETVREIQIANGKISGFVLSRIDPDGMEKYGYGDRRGMIAGYQSGYYRK